MFSEYAGTGSLSSTTGPAGAAAYPRGRMDATNDVFACLFGDLFVKW